MSHDAPQVLIADDDAPLARYLARQFEQAGFRATTSPDAMHALNSVHRNRFDLVVMDIHMPAGNGLAACEMLSSDRRLRQIPVIVLSGRSDAATRLRCQRLGAHFLMKSGDLWPQLVSLAGLLTRRPHAA